MMFSYYGSKSKLVHRYPEPIHDTIIEPFAGSAQYAFKYWEKKVVLVDKYKIIYDLWKWLIEEATEQEILNIPVFETYEDTWWILNKFRKEVRYLVGFQCNAGSRSPAQTVGQFNNWKESNRQRMADNLHKIKHWKIFQRDFEFSPNIEATYFIDPPYNNKAGRGYIKRFNEYNRLKEWIDTLDGQIIVCENEGADWLDFKSIGSMRSQVGSTKEVVFIR